MIVYNEKTVQKAIESILPLNADLIVACNKPKICKKYTSKIIPIDVNMHNKMIELSKTNWQLVIEPWEVLLECPETLLELTRSDSDAYYCNILQDDMITRQIRLWKKDSNKRLAPISDITFYAAPHEIIGDSLYHKAFNLLSCNKYKEFIATAEEYLFYEGGMSAVMTRYYCGVVRCYIFKDMDLALRDVMICLVERPLMAEFWCLLGDIYFYSGNITKAKVFYENAIILGSRRLDDEWPMHIPKYGCYPEEMIGRCKEMISNAKVVAL